MRYGPPVSFARDSHGSEVAYQVLGEGPIDLVFLFGWPSHLALMWENPAFADFLHRLVLVRAGDRLRPTSAPGCPTGARPGTRSRTGWTRSGAVLDAVGSRRGRVLRLPPRRSAGPAVRRHLPAADGGRGHVRRPTRRRCGTTTIPGGRRPRSRSRLLESPLRTAGPGGVVPRARPHGRHRCRHPPLVAHLLALRRHRAREHRRDHLDRSGRRPGGARCRPGPGAGAAPERRRDRRRAGEPLPGRSAALGHAPGAARATTTSRSSATRTPSWP